MSSTSVETRTVKLGRIPVQFPSSDLGMLDECTDLIHDVNALHNVMKDKGYLFIRGLHDREDVLRAREAVLQYLDTYGDKLSKNHPMSEGILREGCGLGCVPFMEGHNEISHRDSMLAVIEGQRPFKFFESYLGCSVVTFDYKWLRAMHREGFTGAHVDHVYMSRGSQELLTMWTPIGDVSVEMGVLAVCEGSHRLPGFQQFQETYGNMDAEEVGLKGTGWFTEDPFEITRKFGGQWKTADFRAGDVLIFGMKTVHMSTSNMTQFARISCDTRWQPASHPMDPRFASGLAKPKISFGLASKMAKPEGVSIVGEKDEEKAQASSFTTIEKLKEEWGI